MEVNQKLFNREESERFYDKRYHEGYMEDWSQDKKQKVREIISELNLTSTGRALDFGCGNGVFTSIIKQQLPQWEVIGTDISEKAVVNAADRIKNCSFMIMDDLVKKNLTYDFVFTHHVLEHVNDLDETLMVISRLVAKNGIVLHVLPCGNKGSFEYNHCMLFENGVDSLNGRFFYEEEGHLRRLSSGRLIELKSNYNFVIANSFFGNQYYGALWWMVQAGWELIQQFTNPANTIDKTSDYKINLLKKKLQLLYQHRRYSEMGWKQLSCYLLPKLKLKIFCYPVATLMYAHSRIIVSRLRVQKDREWKLRKTDPKGSEMYLVFKHC